LIVPAQLLVLGGQRIPLRLRTPLLREGFVHRPIALFAPAVQSRGINSLSPQNGPDTAAIGQGAVGLFLNPLLLFSGKDAPLRLGRHFDIRRTGSKKH